MADRVLVTGAAGRMGRSLRTGLRGHYPTLRLLDVAPQDPAGPGEEVLSVDLNDRASTEAAMDGVDAVIHLAGIRTEAPFDALLAGNMTTTYSVFEAARRARVRRVVFASSHHVTGFYRSDEPVRPEQPVRPDSLYGVSKVFGEALGRLYADKHGIEVVCLRIGTFAAQPSGPRQLSSWLSPGDWLRLVRASLDAPYVGFVVVYGVSANSRRWWEDDAEEILGYTPEDDAETFASETCERSRRASPRLGDRYQGGSFVEKHPDG